ncbi:isocitrate/isopropylmalate family dehydrogenase [Balneolales bacterium ANBcel1]|nr:isocitrate/isopropylmalate family dehydrogenase [Balneolales bacterium ANBcel1]
MHNIVLIEGDGIGPEISRSVLRIFEAAGITNINWIPASAGMKAFEEEGNPLPDETVDLIDKHKVALKGPLTTPVGSGFRSVNVALRQKFDLYSNIRPAKTLPGVPTRFGNVDLVTFRENTQGMYSGIERYVGDSVDHAESVAVVTRSASERIIRAAFDYAVKHERTRVALIHKANIMKYTSGLFLKVGQEISKEYPDIVFNDMIVDNTAMQMVLRPEIFDVIVTTNLFGDILSDLASGLVGGLGVTGSANMGDKHAIFEAVHGSAPDIAGQGKANPTALLLSALMLLEHIGEFDGAEKIRRALFKALPDPNVVTGDLGGKGNTKVFTEAVISFL